MLYEELIHLLKTSETVEDIDKYRNEISMLLPQVRIMFDYDQKNHAHQYDLWLHCLHTVIGLERNMTDDMLYLAAMLHDIGKPDCQVAGTRADDENMHYYGHPERSAEIVENEIIKELVRNGAKLSGEEQQRLIYYVRYHDDHVSLRVKHLRRHLKMTNLENFKKLMLLQVADAKAHVMLSVIEKRIEICEKLYSEHAEFLYEQILAGK